MHLPMTRNLSDYWRIDKSADEVAELCSVMDGAENAVRLLGGKYHVSWAGQSCTVLNKGSIFLDAGVLQGIPVPYAGKAVDVIIGMAVHEAGHEKWTASPDNLPGWDTYSNSIREEIANVHNILEDAYIDNKLADKSPTLGEYVQTARKALYPKNGDALSDEAASHSVNKPDLLNLWSAITLYGGQVPKTCLPEVASALSQLLQRTAKYIGTTSSTERLEQAACVWEWLKQFPSEKPERSEDIPGGEEEGNQRKEGGQSKEGGPKGKEGEEEGEEEKEEGEEEKEEGEEEKEESEKEGGEEEEGEKEVGEEEGGEEEEEEEGGEEEEEKSLEDVIRRNILSAGGEGCEIGDLSTYLNQKRPEPLSSKQKWELRKALDEKKENIQGQLSNLGIYTRGATLKKAHQDKGMSSRLKLEIASEIARVRNIFQNIDTVESRMAKGLKYGKIDGNRLSKVAVGKDSIFKRRDVKEKPDMAIVLLLDVSGSMFSHYYAVCRTACIFATALDGLSNKVYYEVITYSGGSYATDLELTALAKTNSKLALEGVAIKGSTPTGPAIAAAMLRLRKRPEQRKLVIHFTDGFPNYVKDVRSALEICKKNRTEVITISVGYGLEDSTRQEDLYGKDKSEVINSVEELPKAIAPIIRKIYK